MTVIAYKDGVMAADTMIVGGNQKLRAQKLVRMPDGGVAGGAGRWSTAYAILKFIESGGDVFDSVASIDAEDAQVLIARPDGSLWLIDGALPAYPLLDAEASIGCGSDAALMAMSMGDSAVEAIARVTRQDVMCGDPVQSMQIAQAEFPDVVTHEAVDDKPRRKRKS